MADEYFKLIPRDRFKPKSWQSKSWRYGTRNLDWSTPGQIESKSKRRAKIKRVIIAYKSYLKREDGAKKIVGKLKTRKTVNYHCIADTQDELDELLDDVQDLERIAKRANEQYSGKLKNIVKCMVIYDNSSVDCIISLDALHKYFRR